MGPAFISAPDSASPHGSITPGEGASDDMECMIGLIKRKHANRQPFGTDADSDLERPVLARQPRQGAGLCETRVGAIASVVHSLGENYGAEGGRRQEHRLAVSEMRRDQSRDNGLSEGRGRAQDQLGTADGFGDVGRHQRQLHVVAAIDVLDENARARRAMLRYPGPSRRHNLTLWPCKAKSPAAANEPLPPPSTAIFKQLLLARIPAGQAGEA